MTTKTKNELVLKEYITSDQCWYVYNKKGDLLGLLNFNDINKLLAEKREDIKKMKEAQK